MKLKRVIAYILLLAMAISVAPVLQARAEEQVHIIDNTLVGTWSSEGDPYKGYDQNELTKWNPTVDRYEYAPGIVYQFNGAYDLTQAELLLDARYYYFDLYASADSETFTKIASVTTSNQDQYYLDGYRCTVTGLAAENVRYVKLVFTGAVDNSTWVNLHEISFTGTDHYIDEPTLAVTGAQAEGTWKSTGVLSYAYDGNTATKWNPEATDFNSGESIVFNLAAPADMDAVRILFGSRYYYFTLSVSADGEAYEQVGQVTAENKNGFYQGYLCTVDGFTARQVQYIKLSFTGCSDTSKWINLFEITVYEAPEAVEEEPEQQPVTAAGIVNHALVGTWNNDRGSDTNVGPQNAYDGNLNSKWNPIAKNYASGEGIVFTLDATYELSYLQLKAASRYYYFDVSVSSDGETFKTIASVNAENAAELYDENYLCTISELNDVQAQQVKVVFTGASADNLYVNFHEIEIFGSHCGSVYQKAAITAATTEGTWKKTDGIEKAFDGDTDTRWNPQTTGYQSGESAIFTLDQIHDLKKLEITVGSRYYYFIISVSTDGEHYTQIANIHAGNYTDYYLTDYVCTVDGLNAKNTRYIKVQFTGNSDKKLNAYVNFDEIQAYGSPVLVQQWNMTLQDSLQVNFNLSLPESQVANAQLQVKLGDEVTNIAASQLTRLDSGLYLLPVHLAAAQLCDEITICLRYSGTGQLSPAYTVSQYAQALLSDSRQWQYHNIAKQILTYGSAAQSYFDYNTQALADKDINNSAIRTIPQGQAEEMVISGAAAGVGVQGVSLVFLDRIALRFYFVGGENITFAADGQVCTPEKTEDGYCVQVGDILYQDLDQQVCVTATDSNGGVITVKYSPMNYIQRMSQKGSESLATLLQGLYNLHLAAEELQADEKNNSTYLTGATDDLGREVAPAATADASKEVGIFYFLWHGIGGSYLHDVSQILKNDPNAAVSDEAWQAAGGGGTGMVHWWGESIFGHYFAADRWVVERDVIMLTEAGVDFLALDYSNNSSFPQQLLVLLQALDKYYKQGYDVPQVTFITKGSSGEQTMLLYNEAYLAYPQYSHLWYRMEGKPVIVANENAAELTQECLDYFSFLYPQWPREDYVENGFPWMDFGWWTEDGSQAVFTMNDGREMMSVSVAQHCGTLAFSSSAFYGDTTNHTRSYHDGANDPAEDAYLYGYNFGEQFDYAIQTDPDIIFITGWNEWIAGRQNEWTGINGAITDPIIMVDSADINNSRDIQPMRGGYGDNYYMQMIAAIREFKGQKPANVGLNTQAQSENITIDVAGGFDQWNQVSGFYLDQLEDITPRNFMGYGNVTLTNNTGRNDIYMMKLTHDSENLYVYVRTAEDIVGAGDGQCLTMFISTGAETAWNGYDFVVGANALGVVERYTADGWQTAYTSDYALEGNQLQFAIPLSVLGQSGENVSIAFKLADNYLVEGNINDFYLNGDSAPYGRLNYIYEG